MMSGDIISEVRPDLGTPARTKSARMRPTQTKNPMRPAGNARAGKHARID